MAFGNEAKGKGVGKKFGCARKRSTMLHRMLVPSGKVRQTEAARVELCIRELRGNRKGVAAVIDSNDIFAPKATERV